MDLVARQTSIGGHTVLLVSGEVDLATMPRLSDALTRAGAASESIVVDLDGVLVLDDVALGLLLGAAGRARQGGGDVIVVCSTPSTRARLALTGFDRAIRVASSVAELG